MISPEDDIAQSMERALLWGAFLDSLSAPTPAQLWLEQAAAELGRQRDPDGAKKATRAQTIAKLFQRDGHDCWFCAKPLGEDISIEHLQPRALGGTWNDDNLALAHAGCNKAAGHLSRIKKEALREQLQSTRGSVRANNVPTSDGSLSGFRGCAVEPASGLAPPGVNPGYEEGDNRGD